MEKNNNKMRMIGAVTAVVLVVGGLGACMGDDDDATNDATTETSQSTSVAESQSTIVELAQATDSLSTLVAAVVPPTDAAFGDLLEALDVTAEELLAREDLGAILTYHVVSGEVLAADLSDGQVVTTVQGGELTVSVSDAGVVLTDANGGTATVTAADVDASNGVVHLIDAVVLP